MVSPYLSPGVVNDLQVSHEAFVPIRVAGLLVASLSHLGPIPRQPTAAEAQRLKRRARSSSTKTLPSVLEFIECIIVILFFLLFAEQTAKVYTGAA